MISTDTPMSPLMKFVFWFVAANALAGALSLMLLPGHTATLFFWEINPALNASLFGALYFGGAVVVALVTYQGRWEAARFLIPVPGDGGHLDRADHLSNTWSASRPALSCGTGC